MIEDDVIEGNSNEPIGFVLGRDVTIDAIATSLLEPIISVIYDHVTKYSRPKRSQFSSVL